MSKDLDFVLRPVREDDLDALFELVQQAPDPVTTLPADRDYLERRIHASLHSLYPVIDQPGSETYLFVLEVASTKELCGASGIFARVGGYDPCYTYQIQEEIFEHAPLGMTKSVKELHLKLDHKGPSEIGSLYLAPHMRGAKLGSLLSLSRFLFIAQFPERFAEEILVELRGIVNERNESPFWNAVGVHFFGCDYMTADRLSAMTDKSFLQDLMPRHPIYLPLLPKDVQAVIGEVHQNTIPAKSILEREGFEFINEVDIFDAGPVYKARTNAISSVRRSRQALLREVVDDIPEQCPAMLVSSTSLDFRATKCPILENEDGSLTLSAAAVSRLEVQAGETLRYLPLSTS